MRHVVAEHSGSWELPVVGTVAGLVPVLPVLLPLLFVLVVSVYALFVQMGQFVAQQNWLLLVLDAVVLVAAVWVVIEAVGSMNRARREPAVTEDDADELDPSSRL